MTIQVNAGTAAIDWEAMLSKLGTVEKTATPEGKTALTVTVKVDGGAGEISFGVPDDLELPATVDQAAIDSLCGKLLAAKDDLRLSEADVESLRKCMGEVLSKASAAGAKPGSSKSVMFDLYRMMALLVEVAQKQRDASREIRKTENQLVQASILAQADRQRTAALTSMIASLGCCAIQVGFSAYALHRQSNAYGNQTSTMQTSGVASARQNLQMTQAADNALHAGKQLETVRAEVGAKASGAGNKTVEANVHDGFADSRAAGHEFTTRSQNLQSKVEQLQMYSVVKQNSANVKAADIPDAGPVKDAFAARDLQLELHRNTAQELQLTPEQLDEVISMKNDFANLSVADKTRLMDLQMQCPALKGMTKTSAELKASVDPALDAKIAELKTGIETGKAAVETARLEYRGKIASDLKRFESEYNSAVHDKANLPPTATKAEIAAADAKLAQASDNLKLARATAADKLAQKDVTTSKERAFDVESAHMGLDRAKEMRSQDATYLQATRDIQRFEAYNNIIAAIGNVAQSIVANANAFIQATATEKGAEQKRAEEELDQTKDLFHQAQELVEEVTKLMQAINAAEAQSMRDAIQA